MATSMQPRQIGVSGRAFSFAQVLAEGQRRSKQYATELDALSPAERESKVLADGAKLQAAVQACAVAGGGGFVAIKVGD